MATCKEYFRLSNFGLEYDKPVLFVTSQWPLFPNWFYLTYRIVASCYFTLWILLSGFWEYDWYTSPQNRVKWFIYLTNWSYFTLTLSTILQAIIVTHHYIRTKQGKASNDSVPWYYKMTWVIYNLGVNMGFAVTIGYWASDLPPENIHPVDINTHAVNSAYIFVDLLINGMPIRLHHFFHGVLASVIYSIFSAIYSLSGGTNAKDLHAIYPSHDWINTPGQATVKCFIELAITILVWLFVFVIFVIRDSIYRRIIGGEERENILADQEAKKRYNSV